MCGIALAIVQNAPAQEAVSAPIAEAETERITVVGRIDDLTGIATTASQGSVGAQDCDNVRSCAGVNCLKSFPD